MAEVVSTSALRRAWQYWLDRCHQAPWSNPTFYGRTIGGVPTPWVDAVKALESALKATGYQAKSRWAYNFRGIGGRPCSCGNPGYCSLHAYGIAIDIDPAENPFIGGGFSWSKTKFTPTQIAAVEAIKNTKGEQMWTWGGRWQAKQDYMHFQARVDPQSTHVDWSTVVGEEQGEIETMSFAPMQIGDGYNSPEYGDRSAKGSDVAILQSMLNKAYGLTLAEDGDYGSRTAAALAQNVPGGTEQGPTGVPGGYMTGKVFENLLEAYVDAKVQKAVEELLASLPPGPPGPPGPEGPPGEVPDMSTYVQRGDDVTLT